MMQGISLCDHVTERAVIGLRNLVTERDTNYQLPITNHPSGPQK
jgi:hypothetical protein